MSVNLKRSLPIFAVALAMMPGTFAADGIDAPFRTEAARRAKAKYDQEVARAETAYRKSVHDAQARLVAELEPALAAATRRGDLEEANRISELKKTVSDQMKANPRTPNAPIPASVVVGKTFHFSVSAPGLSRLTLNADSTIQGSTHPNETSWRINADGQLEFVHADGRTVTTRFDRLFRNGSEFYFDGAYLLEANKRHGLRQAVE